MLPTAYPYDHQALLLSWRQFTSEEALNGHSMDPAVLRSWHRCRQAGLDPFGPTGRWVLRGVDDLEKRMHEHFEVIAVARPFIEDVFQFVGERGVFVFLADRQLCILDALGDPELVTSLEACGLGQGAVLSESHIGTNAAAMALSEGIAVQVVGPEHYVATLHAFTDTAAPIHAPHGEVLAVLGISTLEREGTPHTLGIVMASAKAIENQLQADLSLSEALQHLAELDVTLQVVPKGILFLDTAGKVTHMNARTGEILGIQQGLALGRQIRSLLVLPAEVDAAMQRCVAIRDREVAFDCGGVSRSCVVSLTPLGPETNLAGFVLTLEPSAEVRHMVHRMVGASAHFTFEDIVGRDEEIRYALQFARHVAQGEANVLLLGEIGTGKEMFAQAIHRASSRAQGPIVSVDCTAIPHELLAVELFGYEGAFLGVEEVGRPGRFELADGGTVFLDNVDGLPLPLQANLLHILDTKEVTRLGSIRSTPVDVRVIAASSSPDLLGEVQRGRFRADLFYRLNVLTLTIPPLRARGNDIVLLVNHLLDKSRQSLGKKVTIAPEAMAMLQSYHWPGNVRELENVLERALYIMQGDVLLMQHLPPELCAANIGRPAERIISIEEAERQAIIRAGRALQGNTSAMAEVLGIGRTTLWRKMKALRIPADSFGA